MINIEVNDIKNILNEFNKESITNELNNYILTQCKNKKLDKKLTLNFIGKISDREKELIGKAIHKHYKKLEQYYIDIDNKDNLYQLLFILIGVLIIYSAQYMRGVFNEFLIILGWVLIWEAFHDIFFGRVSRKIKLKVYRKLARCNIDFKGE